MAAFTMSTTVHVSSPPKFGALSFRSAGGAQRMRAAFPVKGAASRQQHFSVDAVAVEIEKMTFAGDKAGSTALDLKVARNEVAKGLVHKYVVMVRQNARRGTASTKTRAEVRGGGRKPYKQKGTGNARQGSRRTPLRPGGGVVFGPKPRDWSIKMNKKERRLAMATALQSAASSMIVVEDLDDKVEVPKTKVITQALQRWGIDADSDKTYLITKEAPQSVVLSTRNLARVVQSDIAHLNVYDVLNADKVVIEESALAYINDFYGVEGGAWA